MITAQDIREKTFEKSKFGGYDMTEIDDFLEELAEDITASQKENAVLKAKMKVLVEKIEEYRSNESAVNAAILSAQKLALQIESEARARAASMIEEAEAQVKARVGSIDDLTADHERRLSDAQAATKEYCDNIRALCEKQLEKIDSIYSGIILESIQDAGSEAIADIAARIPEDDAAESIPSTLDMFDSTQSFKF